MITASEQRGGDIAVPIILGGRKRLPDGRPYHALVSLADYRKVSKLPWFVRLAKNGSVYAMTSKSGKTIYMHRFILEETESKTDIDHKDGDGLNNTRANLRRVTRQQNMFNARRYITADRTSIFKGVSRNQRKENPYSAFIKHDGKSRFLGNFPDPQSAAKAYDTAARKYFGEFARLNFPEEVREAA